MQPSIFIFRASNTLKANVGRSFSTSNGCSKSGKVKTEMKPWHVSKHIWVDTLLSFTGTWCYLM